MTFALHGIAVSKGVAIGRALVLDATHLEIEHYQVAPERIETEITRLESAIAKVRYELTTLRGELAASAPPEMAAFLDLHTLILEDPLLVQAPADLIRERRYNAEWAIAEQLDVLLEQFDLIEDEYLRERKADIQQVVDRVLKVLAGSDTGLPAIPDGRDEDLIIVARDIAPADMLQFKDRKFAGFATDLGGATSHTAILARSLGIPAVVGLQSSHALIRPHEWLAVDGDAGVLIVEADSGVLEEYRDRSLELKQRKERLKRLRNVATRTLDGTLVELQANIDLPGDVKGAIDAGASGIGLFRSEFLFMNRQESPSEEEQFDAYRHVVEAMGGKPVTIRTLDIGADKSVDAVDMHHEVQLNPALGLRAIRYCLAEPQLFLTQLRAILRASAYGKVRLLIPMLTNGDELRETLGVIELAKSQLSERGQHFDPAVPVGGMIEVPGAALAVGLFLPKLDFLSIGTNDLIQYTLALDRADPAVAGLYDPLHPAVLQLIYLTIQSGVRANKPVSICGEIAGDSDLTRFLLGMGLRQFSAHPSQLLSVKQQVLLTELSTTESVAKKVLKTLESDRIRGLVYGLNQPEAARGVR